MIEGAEDSSACEEAAWRWVERDRYQALRADSSEVLLRGCETATSISLGVILVDVNCEVLYRR